MAWERYFVGRESAALGQRLGRIASEFEALTGVRGNDYFERMPNETTVVIIWPDGLSGPFYLTDDEAADPRRAAAAIARLYSRQHSQVRPS